MDRTENDSQRDEAIEVVAPQLQILKEMIDEIDEDLQWAIRSHQPRRPRPVVHVTSMSLDPLAEDFGQRLNRLKPEDLPTDQQAASAPPPRKPFKQGELWSSRDDDGA